MSQFNFIQIQIQKWCFDIWQNLTACGTSPSEGEV